MRFSDIIGQDETKARLCQYINEQRISHALLFLGPEGNGSLALALAYAQLINCTQRQYGASEACGSCHSCTKYEQLAHPDLHFVYPVASTREVKGKVKSVDFVAQWRNVVRENRGYVSLSQWYDTIGIENKQGIINADDCNEIIKILNFKAYEAEYKVMVIWMAEKLFHSAAPKILKILEEPPEKTLFLLIAEQSDKILPTILSRTQILRVPPVETGALKNYLVKNRGYELIAAHRATVLAEGNVNLAFHLLQNPEKDENPELFIKWMRLCWSGKIADLQQWIPQLVQLGREKQKLFFLVGLQILRQAFISSYLSHIAEQLDENEQDFIKKFGKFINLHNISVFQQMFDDAVMSIERNANPSILLMDMSLKIHRLLAKRGQ